MADETVVPEGVQEPGTPATPAAPAAVDHTARFDSIEQSVKALADTVKAAISRAPATPTTGTTPDGKFAIPDHFRNLLRQQGVTDKEIELNGPVIVPWLTAMLATDGARIAGGVESVRGEVDMLKAARSKKTFPEWDSVEEDVITLRDSALKEGRFLSVKDAYAAAVANDIASPKSKIVEARDRARAARDDGSASSDLSAQNVQHQGTKANAQGTRRTALTAEAIAALPREERKKLFDGELGDLKIR